MQSNMLYYHIIINTGLDGVHVFASTSAVTGTLQAQALGRLLHTGTSISAAIDEAGLRPTPLAPCVCDDRALAVSLLLHVGFIRFDV